MISAAPRRRAPWIALTPTPPAPITAPRLPAPIRDRLDRRADAGDDRAPDERGHVRRHARPEAGCTLRAATTA